MYLRSYFSEVGNLQGNDKMGEDKGLNAFVAEKVCIADRLFFDRNIVT